MSTQVSHLKSLLSPSKSASLFAPFRSRSANPDGFDSKMRLWMDAIEEWALTNKKLTFTLQDIHQTFISDSGIKPDKECIRLVFSEMKRQSRLVSLKILKTSKPWSCTHRHSVIDSYLDPKGWLNWGIKKLVYTPATWAISSIVVGKDETYSDLTDMSITDKMKFASFKSLHIISENLLNELIRICMAEKQNCFEWQHLLELVNPIMNTIVNVTDGVELLDILELLMEYLVQNEHIALRTDNDCRLVRVACPDDKEEKVTITQKDIAMARLLRAKEILTADADKCRNQAHQAKQDALASYSRKEVAKAKSLLRTHNRMLSCAEKKESQLTNVEIMLEQLENTDSNQMIIQAYKEGAEALKTANTNMETSMAVFDDVLDATAEARYLNEEMDQMLNNISCLSQGAITNSELETELNNYIRQSEKNSPSSSKAETSKKGAPYPIEVDDKLLADLEERLNSLVVCQDDPTERMSRQKSPERASSKLPAT